MTLKLKKIEVLLESQKCPYLLGHVQKLDRKGFALATKIVLVHGLNGDLSKTWGKFPQLLDADPELEIEVVSYGYGFYYWPFVGANESIHNLAEGLATEIDVRCSPDDELILVGHSLGGLVIRRYLLDQFFKRKLPNIKKVCFFAVPQNGSGLSNIAGLIGWRNQQLKVLCKDNKYLEEMNDQWVSTEVGNNFEILSVIGGRDSIVTSESSKSIFREYDVKTIEGRGHIDVVKPSGYDDTSYLVLKQFILAKNSVVRYLNEASRALNDWKSVDRKHAYQYVSDDKRNVQLASLVEALRKNQSVVRLIGASGLGKTRILLHAIEDTDFINDDCVLVFDGIDHKEKIKDSIRRAVDDNAYGLAIVDNCSVDLHNVLSKEVSKKPCQLRLVTIGYSPDHVEQSIFIKLEPLDDGAIKELLTPILVGLNSGDVGRVAKFAQGYPLMATLIASQYQANGKLLGSIQDHSVVNKLIDGNEGVGEQEKDVLSACSLFDVFGIEQGDAAAEAKYIAENIANSTMKVFDRVIRIFGRRQIINRAGRYARVVPKPLALTLAATWWEEASFERQTELIDNMPGSLMQSFCTQASYLDGQPSVQRFSEKLFGANSPFVKAEVLLTERGSKLFRAFVDVNPEVTSRALYNFLDSFSLMDIKSIGGDVRRNLVWALEKLSFHVEVFEEAAWSLMLLAAAENESWSNNSTGLFSQLYRVQLSGTAAEPDLRLHVLNKALKLNQADVDMVVIDALGQAISTYGGSRMVGAEHQGTKATLEEWRPKSWKDIFDYWEAAFNLLVQCVDRGEQQKTKVLNIIGHSIRGLVSAGRIEMLDAAIKKIVEINGQYWPAALEGIHNSIEFDSAGLKDNQKEALQSWLDLLDPKAAGLPEQLQIVVSDPPWEHRRGEDGHYVDVASENAMALASKVAENIDELIPHLDMLLEGQQKQSYSFGLQLSRQLDNVDGLLKESFERLVNIDDYNLNFVLGIYAGIFEKSPAMWDDYVDTLAADCRLLPYYPEIIRTGDIKKKHLDALLHLIKEDIVPENSANLLSYGSVTDGLAPEEIAEFCLSLSEMGGKASWSALNVVYLYCFSNQDSTDKIREQLKILVLAVPLSKGQKDTQTDFHHWHDLAQKILKERDEEFAVALARQLISASQHGFDHGDIWSYIKPLLIEVMGDYCEEVWRLFAGAIVNAEGMEIYWLKELLDRENSFSNKLPSVLSVVPIEQIISWCDQHPDIGPAFVASCVNILQEVDDQQQPTELFIALLERFGHDDDVASSLAANMGTRGWSGSLVPYLQADKAALSTLRDHQSPNVRGWIKKQIASIDKQIEYETERDDERELGVF